MICPATQLACSDAQRSKADGWRCTSVAHAFAGSRTPGDERGEASPSAMDSDGERSTACSNTPPAHRPRLNQSTAAVETLGPQRHLFDSGRQLLLFGQPQSRRKRWPPIQRQPSCDDVLAFTGMPQRSRRPSPQRTDRVFPGYRRAAQSSAHRRQKIVIASKGPGKPNSSRTDEETAGAGLLARPPRRESFARWRN